jgi:zinc D-Ala-D-Ala carboxypeptidase
MVQLVCLARIMEQVRALCGNRPISVSSGYRCHVLNRQIGGATNSDHIDGRAVDFTVSGLDNKTVFDLIRGSDISYSKLILEYPKSKSGGWVHLAIHPYGATSDSRINLLATKVGDKTTYTNVV